MSETNRVEQLLSSLSREIQAAKPGSAEGQFPILDLIANLRDAAEKQPETKPQHELCVSAWNRMVTIVESGRPFSAEEIQWLQQLLSQLAPGATPLPAAAISAPGPESAAAPPAASAPPVLTEEAPLHLNLESDAELLREFNNEAREHLDNIEQGLLVLENQPDDAETLNTIFRAFHTFKGSAGFLNLIPINRLAHVLESLLDLARQGKLTIDASIIDLILRGRDTLKKFVDEMDGQLNGSRAVAAIEIPTAELKAAVQRVLQAVATGAQPAPEPAASAPAQDPIPLPPPHEAVPTAAAPAAAVSSTPAASPAPTHAAAQSKPTGGTPQRTDQGGIVKVDTAKLDALLDLVGEMVIAQSLVAQDLGHLTGLSPQFTRNMAQLSRITKELQRVSMSMRMMPIRAAFHKMARLVRDLSAKQSKKVQLLTEGEETELDRGMVEELNDPLLHMIRNSIDHGVEAPEVRASRGKAELATVRLSAYHQGGNIVIEVADDGNGLNRDRILAKAIERGLTTAEAKHTDQEIFSFIFAAGFSTAEKITDVSGRGVGMDVVRRNIEKLHGTVDIASVPGKGTTFKITLPLTLAIIDGLIVKVGEERYIVPTLSVRESFRPRPEMISRVNGVGEVVNVRGRLLPLLRLYECFGIPGAATDPTQGIVVVAQAGTEFRCLLVDGLLHKQEVVIKNLNDLMIHKNRSLAGAAILGDGRVGLILDVNSLVHQEPHSYSKAA